MPRSGLWLAAVALGVGTGFCGWRGGLPSARRLEVLPPEARGPRAARALADAWRALYERIERSHAEMSAEEPVTYIRGVERAPAGWTAPPPPLVNSVRSFLLQSVNPDEKKAFIILARMRPWKLDFQPLYVQYGGGIIYPLGAWLWAASKAGLARLSPDPAYYLEHPDAMGRLYALGRLFMLLFQTGAIVLVAALGRRLGGVRAGLVAAAVYALLPPVLENAHLIKPHAYAAFWALASVWFLLSAQGGAKRRALLWAGLLAGVAAGSNLALAPLCAAPLLVGRDRDGLLGSAAGALVLAALNPYLIVAPRAYAWELTVYAGAQASPSFAALGRLAVSSARLLGPVFCAGAAAAAVWALRRGGQPRLAALVAVGLSAIVWARFPALVDAGAFRLYLPMLALAAVLLGAAVEALPRAARAAALALLVVDVGARGGLWLARLREGAGDGSTRARAAAWIEASVPAGSELGFTRFPAPSSSPTLPFYRYAVTVFDPAAPAPPQPAWLVVDQAGLGSLDKDLANRYDQAASFLPVGARWLPPDEAASFADAAVYVLKRRSPTRS